MPRDELSIFAFGMPSFKDAKESFLGTKPLLKISNPDNEVAGPEAKRPEAKVEAKPKAKPEAKKPKKRGEVVKNHILSLLTKVE